MKSHRITSNPKTFFKKYENNDWKRKLWIHGKRLPSHSYGATGRNPAHQQPANIDSTAFHPFAPVGTGWHRFKPSFLKNYEYIRRKSK
jgi:hypothetical protein